MRILFQLNDRKMSLGKNAGVESYGSCIIDVVWHVSTINK